MTRQVLGVAATTYGASSYGPTTKQALIAALEDGAAVTAAVFDSGDATLFQQLSLVSGHAYEVAGYDFDPNSPTFDTFQLKNPWGYYEPARLTWDELCAYSAWFSVAETSPSAIVSSQVADVAGQAIDAANQEVRAAALAAVCDQQCMPDAVVAAIANPGNSLAANDMQDTRVRAANMVLAEFGQ